MADNRRRQTAAERSSRVLEELADLRRTAAETKNDLDALRSSMWAMLKADGVGPEELAVGLALLASISSHWPRAYAPDVPTLARLAKVEPAVVTVALDTFLTGEVLRPGAET